MSMDLVNLLISLISGVVGGNAAGAAMPNKSLGAVGNSIAGLFGGGIGGTIAQALGLLGTAGAAAAASSTGATSGLDLASILANVASSGVGGAVLMAIVGFIKNAMNK